MSKLKHQNSRSRVRLAAESATNGYPLAGPVPAEQFVSVSRGDAALQPKVEASLPFVFSSGLTGVSVAHLRICGFEGIELLELQAELQEPEAPVVAAVPPAPPTRFYEPPARSYEPMEFLDFDEPGFEDQFEAQVAPEPESEPEPPAMATVPLALPVRFASPGPSKLMQGADIPMRPLPVQLPEAQLRTVRRKMVMGANPNKPVAKPEPTPQAPAPKQAVQVPKPALQVVTRPAPSPKQPARPVPPAPVVRPAMAARDRGSALSVPREQTSEAAPFAVAVPVPVPVPVAVPAPKPKLMPIRQVETPAATPAATSAPMLAITVPTGSKVSPAMKGVIAAGAVVVLGLGGYFGFSGKDKFRSSEAVSTVGGATMPGMVMGGGGWTTTWGLDVPANKGRQISIFRPSMAMTDYRFEFRGQIERKALGWIFRASNPKNYYVMKLEMIKPGANPMVALIKYAVIDGKETTRTQMMLPFPVALDTVYQVRFDVKGDKFTTYVQNKLVDYWTDDRIKTGGTGFFNDKGERGSIKSSQVAYLTAGS